MEGSFEWIHISSSSSFGNNKGTLVVILMSSSNFSISSLMSSVSKGILSLLDERLSVSVEKSGEGSKFLSHGLDFAHLNKWSFVSEIWVNFRFEEGDEINGIHMFLKVHNEQVAWVTEFFLEWFGFLFNFSNSSLDKSNSSFSIIKLSFQPWEMWLDIFQVLGLLVNDSGEFVDVGSAFISVSSLFLLSVNEILSRLALEGLDVF